MTQHAPPRGGAAGEHTVSPGASPRPHRPAAPRDAADVIIVGAGPAGSTTAFYLAHAGCDVLLLEKSTFPREKVCGDGLTPRALWVLDDMNILPEVAAQGCAIGGYRVVAPNGRTTTARLNGAQAALAVPRLKLDDIILRRAMAVGKNLAHFPSHHAGDDALRIERVGGIRTDGAAVAKHRDAVGQPKDFPQLVRDVDNACP